MPAAFPAEVRTSPSSTNRTSASRWTAGNRRANVAPCTQCVVAGRPSSSPAAARTKAPVQMETMRARAAVRRSSSASSSGTVPSVIAGVPYTPGITTVRAVARIEASCSGRIE